MWTAAVVLLPVCVRAQAPPRPGTGKGARRFDDRAAWTRAHLAGPLTAAETRKFMKRLARYVEANHLKTAADSPQRGMCYEYVDVRRKGHYDQWVQGEGLDTMHDGAWYAAAMVNAARATGDDDYKRFLVTWQLPFYLKMLNHSDTLFTWKGATSRKGAAPWGKPWAFQEGEKGFVPYWWDDGASVSLERRRSRHNLTNRPSVNRLAGKPNPKALLSGYALGMSNHMAQDLAVMVQQSWLLLRGSQDAGERKLAGEVATAAAHLHACRMRHFGRIPMCAAAAALCTGDAELMKRVPGLRADRALTPGNHIVRCLRTFPADRRLSLPGFADNQQYSYYTHLARSGGKVSRALAFQTVYDAYTEPMLFRYYCDDWPVPAGINRFDLHGIMTAGGKLCDYRSDRKGHFGLPKPIGSRMGPQNMIVCGWAVQMLKAMPGLWEEPCARRGGEDVRVVIVDPAPGAGPAGKVRPAEVRLGPARLEIVSTRHAMKIRGRCRGRELTVTLFDRPDCGGTHAAVTVRPGSLTAVNGQGKPLIVTGKAAAAGAEMSFEFELPYTVVKAQRPWGNGLEHCRYSVAVGAHKRNLYLASAEPQVLAWLRHELGAGLRTWRAVFDDKGCIPTGMGTGRHWDTFSDTGGYAHLISAAAQWLLILEGKFDWQVHGFPDV